MSIFMNYEGIKGESSDSGHSQWIDIDRLSWGVGRKVTSASSTTGDRESNNAVITDLTLTRRVDSATPKFFLESCCGTGKKVTLHLTKTGQGSGADIYLEYILKNAVISQYNVDATSNSSERPLERMVLSFVEIEVKYTPYDQNGEALSPTAVGFNTATNSKK
ncbi:MAG: type VI secretion system tube protein Hcp [Gammaproteobacteria bacterium]|nr:type VI secretion system tube protein Hcp [Gammaproteobacteria bacterium]